MWCQQLGPEGDRRGCKAGRVPSWHLILCLWKAAECLFRVNSSYEHPDTNAWGCHGFVCAADELKHMQTHTWTWPTLFLSRSRQLVIRKQRGEPCPMLRLLLWWMWCLARWGLPMAAWSENQRLTIAYWGFQVSGPLCSAGHLQHCTLWFHAQGSKH